MLRRARSGPGAVMGFLLAGVLLVLSLLTRVELTAASEDMTRLEREIRTLEEERTQLQIAMGDACDLEAIERYAVEVLGMVHPGSEQFRYRENVPPDRVEILAREGAAGRLAALRESAVQAWRNVFPGGTVY